MIRVAWQQLVLLVWVTAGLSAAAEVNPEPMAAAEPPERTGVLLYISSEKISDHVIPVGETRDAALSTLHEQLTGAGHDVLSADEMEAVAGHWRIRSDWAVSRPFLDDLATEWAVTRLQVMHLRIEKIHLSLSARLISCPSGDLLRVETRSVAVPEPPPGAVEPDPGAWRAALADLCRRLPAEPAPVPMGDPLLVLPVDGIGCEDYRALAASVCILQRLLEESRWLLPDPSLVATTLSRRGLGPHRLGSRGRRCLREEFHSDQLVRQTLVVYQSGRPRGVSQVFDEDLALGGSVNFGDFDLNLRVINLADGTISHSSGVYAPATSDEGWFGTIHHRSPLERIEQATRNLWQEFRRRLEDN